MDRVKQEPDSLASSTPSPLPSPLPTGSYTDFVLRSTAPSTQTGWRYNIMKFGAVGERSIDPTSEAFIKPVKLNRKDPRTVRRLTDEDRERINRRAMEKNGMVVDGVKDEDGVKNEGDEDVKKEREEMDMSLVGTGTSGLAPAVRNKNNMFKKKTKRVFVSSEEARRLKREEWMPWVLEDDEGNERWIGRLEGGTGESGGAAAAQSGITSAQIKQDKADKNGTGMKGWRPPSAPSEAGGGGSSYVAFVFGDNGDEFQVVPVNRWYKFSQGPKYVTLGTDEAETEYERQQKSQDPERWIMHRRNAPASGSSTPVGPVASTSSSSKPRVKKEAAPAPAAATIRSRLLDKSVLSARRASAPDRAGRPKFKSVDVGGRGEDEDDELSGRKTKGDGGRGQEQEHDEFDYEEDFQDDEEGIATIDDLADEEETKKLEERIKKEMRTAERPDEIPDDDDEDMEELTNTGKEVKKLVKKSDKSGAYDSDDDDNPYASSEYDEEGSVASLDLNAKDQPSRSSSQRPGHSSHHRSNSSSHRPSSSSHSRHHSTSNSRPGSRSGSPSGSALVAKRATSPTGSTSGRSKSAPGSRNASPGPSGGGGKRKRTEGEDADAAKRRKNGGGGTPPPSSGELITEADLVALFKTRPSFTLTTKDVLAHFKKALKADPRNKAAIGGMLQSVANLVGKELVLKAGY